MIVIAVDGPAHSGKKDFVWALQRLTAHCAGYGPVQANEQIFRAAKRRHPELSMRAQMVRARTDEDLRRDEYRRIRTEAEQDNDAVLLVTGADSAGPLGFPHADEACFVNTPLQRRMARATAIQDEDWYVRRWAKAAVADRGQDDPFMTLRYYLSVRDGVAPGEDWQAAMSAAWRRASHRRTRVAPGEDWQAAMSEPTPPAPDGYRELTLPYDFATGFNTVLEDLLAVDWLASIRDLLDDAGIPSIDPEMLPEYDHDNPEADPIAAGQAAKALHALVEKLNEQTWSP